MQNVDASPQGRFRRFPWRLVLACVLAALALAPAYIRLLMPAQLSVPERFGTFRPGAATATSVPLELGEAKEGEQVLSLAFEVKDSRRLVRAASLDLALAIPDEAPTMISGRIDIAAMGCSFVADADRLLWKNAEQRFSRQGDCHPAATNPTTAQLTIVTTGERKLGVSALAPHQPDGVADYFVVPADWRSTKRAPLYLQGKILPDDSDLPRASRLHVLLHVWGFEHAAKFILSGFLVIFALLAAGAYCALRRPTKGGFAAAIGAWALAYAMAYAFVTPPYQAQGEANYVRSFLHAAERDGDDEAALELANRSHFTRLRMQPGESLTVYDSYVPLAGSWPRNVPVWDEAGRPKVTGASWRVMAPLVASLSVPQTLLSLRILNALAFAFILILAAFFAAPTVWPRRVDPGSSSIGVASDGLFMALMFLLVPAYPFFAMAASERATTALVAAVLGLVTSGFICLTVTTKSALSAVIRAAVMGWLAGVLALETLAGLMAPPFVFAVVGYTALGVVGGALRRSDRADEATASPRSDAAWRWGLGTLMVGACALALVLTLGIGGRGWVERLVALFVARGLPLNVPQEYVAWLPAAAAAGAWLVMALVFLLAARRGSRAPVPARARTWASVIVLVVAFASFYAWSQPVSQLPMLNGAQAQAGVKGAFAYLLDALRILTHGLGFGTPQLNLFASFWGGFGWLDASPSLKLISWLHAFAVAGIVLGAVLAWMDGDERYARRGFALASLVVCFILYAFGSWILRVELQGRTLLVWHALFLPLALLGWADLVRRIQFAEGVSGRQIAMGLAFLVSLFVFQHSLTTLVIRYYGA